MLELGGWGILLVPVLISAIPALLVVAVVFVARRMSTTEGSGISGGVQAWRKPGRWLLLYSCCLFGLLVTWFIGAFSGGHEVDETCGLRHGQTYDHAYRAEHWREPSQWFPLHNKCNADFDLVPFWVNPVLVILWLGAVGCLAAAILLRIGKSPDPDGTLAGR